MKIKFDTTYKNLPEYFFKKASPLSFKDSTLIKFNHNLAKQLRIDSEKLSEDQMVRFFCHDNHQLDPIAQAYAGHQFGHFNPQLGDGRACLLGEVISRSNKRFDISLKGCGKSPFSRNGDGKSAIGPVIREYIISEAMSALNVPTTRALCAIRTNEPVYREEELPGALFVRVASSHIRIGTFEYAAAYHNDSIKDLADYTIKRHYPYLLEKESENIYLDFIKEVCTAQASMIAQWMGLGFIHGVMNTDNMTITGETIDYGPCAFMDEFSFDKVFSSIDRNSRYCYNNQIEIGKWNLFKFASTLLELIDKDQDLAIQKTQDSIYSYLDIYEDQWLKVMAAKLGIKNPKAADKEIINDFLGILQTHKLDFTNSFRQLESLRSNNLFDMFFKLLDKRYQQENIGDERFSLMNNSNPVYIPRNHLVQKAIEHSSNGDDSEFEKLNKVLETPFQYNKDYEQYTLPPEEDQRVLRTFCGT